MLFETKIFLFCLSLVLLPEAVHLTDLEITSCTSKEITALAKTDGVYYVKKSGGSMSKLNQRKSTDVSLTIPLPAGGNMATVIRVNTEDILTKNYDAYSVTCTSVVKTTLTFTLPVNIGTTPKPINISVNQHISVKFSTKNQQSVKAVTLGEVVTMNITADKIFKKIDVKKCDASDGSKSGKSLRIYPSKRNIMKLTPKGNSATLVFEAFQLISSKKNTVIFKCDLILCVETICKPSNNPAPASYEAPRGVKHVSFDGVLAVYLPPRRMVSHAVKATSYTKGALLTLAAVLLQHQLG